MASWLIRFVPLPFAFPSACRWRLYYRETFTLTDEIYLSTSSHSHHIHLLPLSASFFHHPLPPNFSPLNSAEFLPFLNTSTGFFFLSHFSCHCLEEEQFGKNRGLIQMLLSLKSLWRGYTNADRQTGISIWANSNCDKVKRAGSDMGSYRDFTSLALLIPSLWLA